MTIKELLVLFKFDVDDASFAYAQSLLNKMEEKAGGLEQQSNKDDYFDGVGKGANKASLGVNALIGRMRMLAGLAGISLTVNGLIQTADQWRTIEGQVKNVIGEEENLEDIQERLYQVAGRTRQSYAQTAGLFTSVSRSASELGKSTDEILAFTEDVAMALRAGGGNADSQAAALVQLGQALGSGALRGDELNSILEQAPVLANTIAQGMGTSIGQLRRLGREGKITSAIIFESVRKMHDDLVRQTANAPLTVNAAFLRVRDAVSRVIYRAEKGIGIVNRIAEGIADVADAIDKTNVELLVAGLKVAAFWAGVLFVNTHGTAVLLGLTKVAGVLAFIGKLLMSVMGFTVTWGSLGAAVGAAVTIFAAKLVIALTAVFLLLEDLYHWFSGSESIIGDFFGSWEECLKKIKNLWMDIETAMTNFRDMNISNAIKDALKWVEELYDKLVALNPRKMWNEWWDENVSNPVNDFISGVANGANAQGPALSAAQVDAYRVINDSVTTNNSRSVNNSGNTTNNINITAPNGTAEAYAQAISNVLPGSPSYDFAMD